MAADQKALCLRDAPGGVHVIYKFEANPAASNGMERDRLFVCYTKRRSICASLSSGPGAVCLQLRIFSGRASDRLCQPLDDLWRRADDRAADAASLSAVRSPRAMALVCGVLCGRPLGVDHFWAYAKHFPVRRSGRCCVLTLEVESMAGESGSGLAARGTLL